MKSSPNLSLLALPLLVVGCGGSIGGSSSPTAKAKASLQVIWPERNGGRLIPQAANGIKVVLSQNGTAVGTATVARPATGNSTQTDFSDLPVGSLDVSVKAFPNADASGTAQAVGTGTLTTTLASTGTVTVSLASTAASLSISPASPQVGRGTTQALTASALDSAGNIVLLSAGGGSESLAWDTDNHAVATVIGSGPTATLKGLAGGTVHVAATLTTDDNGGAVTGTGTPTVVAASGTVIVR